MRLHRQLKEGIGLNIAPNKVWYFAYGSCMGDDFVRTVPTYQRIGSAVLKGYRIAFSRYSYSRQGGVADIIQDDASEVEGILYQIGEDDIQILDDREGVHVGIYRRIPVNVQMGNRNVKALTYEVVDKSLIEYAPDEYYASLILGVAKQMLSNEYATKLTQHIEKLNDKGMKLWEGTPHI